MMLRAESGEINREDHGFTLIEEVAVIAILGILLAIAGMSAQKWIMRYRVEGLTREFYADLMNTRVKAFQRNRIFFVSLPDTGKYVIYEDSNPWPDGDGDLQPDQDRIITEKTTVIPLRAHLGLGLTTVKFSTNGITSLNGALHFDSSVDPLCDCVKLHTTRVLIGKWNGSSCIAL